jgi:hypothetical protein
MVRPILLRCGGVTALSDLAHIREISSDIRGVFETMLVSSIGTAQIGGACLHAAVLLASILTKFAGASTLVCGGSPPIDGGLLDTKGVCRGHYWVEGVCTSGEAFIADITADQFGYEPVVVLLLSEGRLRYQPGDAALVAEHVAEELSTCACGAGEP